MTAEVVAEDIQPIYTKPPSYIKEILKSSEDIYLVYNKLTKPNVKETSILWAPEESNLDLTGNPLTVDLSSDISIIPHEEHLWSHEENNHYPFPLKTARRIINKFNKQSLGTTDTNSYIYCICDGTDRKCTLIVGAYQSDSYIGRTEICNRGCFNRTDPRINLNAMKEKHLSNLGIKNCQVKSLISATYIVYGSNLRKYKISNTLPDNACILYNVSWNAYQYEVPEYVQSAEMTVQTIIGHKGSEMWGLWQQFTLLRLYMNILVTQPTDLEKVILSSSQRNCMEISEEICALLTEMSHRRTFFKKKFKAALDFDNLRQEDLIDQLWNLMISCNKVSDLKTCFHVLFEEMAMSGSFKPKISSDNKSSIAAIISEIASGRLSVPTLSLFQALQCLIDLGIEKLKNDYFYILDHFDCLNYKSCEAYWSKVTGECPANISAPSNTTTSRMRFTAQVAPSLIDTSERITKINCLLRMHTACNFLILGEKAQLSTKESFNALIQSINRYLVETDNNASPLNFFSDCVLEEIKVKLQSNDVGCLHDKDPITWNVELASKYDRSAVTTIFHHSVEPVFPPCIYNNYDSPPADGSDIYYVAEIANFTEKI